MVTVPVKVPSSPTVMLGRSPKCGPCGCSSPCLGRVPVRAGAFELGAFAQADRVEVHAVHARRQAARLDPHHRALVAVAALDRSDDIAFRPDQRHRRRLADRPARRIGGGRLGAFLGRLAAASGEHQDRG